MLLDEGLSNTSKFCWIGIQKVNEASLLSRHHWRLTSPSQGFPGLLELFSRFQPYPPVLACDWFGSWDQGVSCQQCDACVPAFRRLFLMSSGCFRPFLHVSLLSPGFCWCLRLIIGGFSPTELSECHDAHTSNYNYRLNRQSEALTLSGSYCYWISM